MQPEPATRAVERASRRLRSPGVPAALLVGALAALLASKLGAALVAHPDTCHYVSAAEHLAAGHGLVTSVVQWGTEGFAPMTTYPPGFPAAAAVFRVLGQSAQEGMALVLGASFVAYAVLAQLLFAEALGKRLSLLAPLLTASLMVQPGVLNGLRSALSDLPSGALTLGSIVFALRSAGCSRQHDLALGVLLGLGITFRWAGLYFALAVVLVTVLFGWRGPEAMADRFRRAALVLAGVLAVVTPLWIRNYLVAGNLMGARPPRPTPVTEHASQALLGVSDWFQVATAPLPASDRTIHLAIALVVLALAAACAVRNRSRKAATLALVIGVYFGMMVVSASRTSIDPLSRQRFWLGIYPVALGAVVAALSDGQAWKWPRLGASLLTSLVLLHASHGFAKDVSARLRTGPRLGGFFAPAFAESRILSSALAASDARRCYLVANDVRPLLPWSGTRPVRIFPDDPSRLAMPDGSLPCLVLFAQKHISGKPRDVHSRVRRQVSALAQKQGLRRIGADSVAELWAPAGAANGSP